MCSCPGPSTRPPCTRWSGPNPKGRPSWICPTGSRVTATPSSPRRCRAPATSVGDRHPQQPWTCGGSRLGNCGPNATGSAACSTRPPGIGRGSWRGPAPAEPSRPDPGATHRQHEHQRHGRGMLRLRGPAGPASTDRAAAGCWPASRPTAPPTPNSRCASINSAGLAGWRPTPSSAPPTAKSSANWPGSAVPAASPRAGAAWLPARRTRPGARESTRGRRAWRQAAATIEDYRRTYHITDPEQALGPHAARARPAGRLAARPPAIARVQGRHHRIDHDRQPQRGAASRRQSIDRYQQNQPPTRTERAVPPGRPDPERAAG